MVDVRRFECAVALLRLRAGAANGRRSRRAPDGTPPDGRRLHAEHARDDRADLATPTVDPARRAECQPDPLDPDDRRLRRDAVHRRATRRCGRQLRRRASACSIDPTQRLPHAHAVRGRARRSVDHLHRRGPAPAGRSPARRRRAGRAQLLRQPDEPGDRAQRLRRRPSNTVAHAAGCDPSHLVQRVTARSYPSCAARDCTTGRRRSCRPSRSACARRRRARRHQPLSRLLVSHLATGQVSLIDATSAACPVLT